MAMQSLFCVLMVILLMLLSRMILVEILMGKVYALHRCPPTGNPPAADMHYPGHNLYRSQPEAPLAYSPGNAEYLPYEAQYRPPPTNANYDVNQQPEFTSVKPTAPPQPHPVQTTYAPQASAVQAALPLQTSLPTYTPQASAVQAALPFQSRLPTYTPQASAVQAALPFQSRLPMYAPQTSTVHTVMTFPHRTSLPTPIVQPAMQLSYHTNGVYVLNQPPVAPPAILYTSPTASTQNRGYVVHQAPVMPPAPQPSGTLDVIRNFLVCCLNCLIKKTNS
ncbi:adhesive plaque matrix protein-like isoform X2 [Hyla sarda]|uniref:adhesive plaque matrix protein-like isoform X2 n=1 Tax=Hyla sarda TaxID=327740 RepID=UPI0024C3FD6A|nr:adhesive plaque matrix protein-like isoform X2 [Hyla sarda]